MLKKIKEVLKSYYLQVTLGVYFLHAAAWWMFTDSPLTADLSFTMEPMGMAMIFGATGLLNLYIAWKKHKAASAE